MDETNTNGTERALDELEMFKMSAQHLVQLVEYYRGTGDARLALAVERAIKAHVTVAQSLAAKGLPSSEPAKVPSAIEEAVSDKGVDETWVEQPWEYLKIPARPKGRLGPMPRFVPLPTTKSLPESEES